MFRLCLPATLSHYKPKASCVNVLEVVSLRYKCTQQYVHCALQLLGSSPWMLNHKCLVVNKPVDRICTVEIDGFCKFKLSINQGEHSWCCTRKQGGKDAEGEQAPAGHWLSGSCSASGRHFPSPCSSFSMRFLTLQPVSLVLLHSSCLYLVCKCWPLTSAGRQHLPVDLLPYCSNPPWSATRYTRRKPARKATAVLDLQPCFSDV